MNSRIRTQKKIFTPTTTTVEPESFLCQIIDTGEFLIVHRSSIKRIYDDTAEITVQGRRTEATIEFRGTREECRRVWEKKEELRKSNNFDEPDCSENEEDVNVNDDEAIEILTNFSNFKSSTKSHTPKRKCSPLASVNQNNHRSSALNPAKRSKPNDFEKEAEDMLTVKLFFGLRHNCSANDDITNGEDNDEQGLTFVSASSLMKYMDIQFNTIREENEKQFTQLSKKIERKHHIDIMDLSSYRESGCDHTPNEVMYEGKNLLYVRGKNVGDYARQILRTIFTQEELLSSILPPGGGHYNRKPLDEKKFEYFHNAMHAKYRIKEDRYDEFYSKLVRPKLVDFLGDERKRERKRSQ